MGLPTTVYCTVHRRVRLIGYVCRRPVCACVPASRVPRHASPGLGVGGDAVSMRKAFRARATPPPWKLRGLAPDGSVALTAGTSSSTWNVRARASQRGVGNLMRCALSRDGRRQARSSVPHALR